MNLQEFFHNMLSKNKKCIYMFLYVRAERVLCLMMLNDANERII